MTYDWRSSLIEHSVLFWWDVSRQFPVYYMRSCKNCNLFILKSAILSYWDSLELLLCPSLHKAVCYTPCSMCRTGGQQDSLEMFPDEMEVFIAAASCLLCGGSSALKAAQKERVQGWNCSRDKPEEEKKSDAGCESQSLVDQKFNLPSPKWEWSPFLVLYSHLFCHS